MSAVRAAGLGVILAFAATATVGTQTAFAALPVPAQGQVALLNAEGAQPRPVRAELVSAVSAALPAVPAKAAQPSAVAVITPQLAGPAAASSVSAIAHSNGRLAGLGLIVINIFVGVSALLLNRRRRSDS
jgi:hypothetical protein